MWLLRKICAKCKSVAPTMMWPSTGCPKAFTLIECLVALGVLALSVVLISPIMETSQTLSTKLAQYGDQELEVALIQLEYELSGLDFAEVQGNTVIFYDETGRKAEFKVVNQTFIKRLNSGYHPLLTKVKKMVVEKQESSILLTFTFLDGRVRCGKIQLPST